MGHKRTWQNRRFSSFDRNPFWGFGLASGDRAKIRIVPPNIRFNPQRFYLGGSNCNQSGRSQNGSPRLRQLSRTNLGPWRELGRRARRPSGESGERRAAAGEACCGRWGMTEAGVWERTVLGCFGIFMNFFGMFWDGLGFS